MTSQELKDEQNQDEQERFFINEKGMKINRILKDDLAPDLTEANFFNERIGKIENLDHCAKLRVT